jgi:hypothetical protein
MARLNDEEQHRLVNELVSTVKEFTPGWTNQPDPDPGITLLELLTWLLDSLGFEAEGLSDRRRVLLTQLVDELSKLLRDSCTSGSLTRPRFFSGQLLTAADLEAEQDYTRKSMRQHNRCFFGSGIVTGLAVALDSSSVANDEPVITVAPGCAIDSDGEQLILCEPLSCLLRARILAGYVILCYFEQAIDPVPALSGSLEPSRITEGVAVHFEERLPGKGVAIARLERIAGRWVLDPQFRPAQIKFGS